jgi:hypothetical protein
MGLDGARGNGIAIECRRAFARSLAGAVRT